MDKARLVAAVAALMLCGTTAAPLTAQTTAVVSAPGRTALYFQFGQSNAVGLAPLGRVPNSRDYSTGPRPIQELELFEGSGESAKYRLRNLYYLRTSGDKAVDGIEGAISGPRAETVIDLDTGSVNTAVSSFVGVAEQIAGGYNSAASRVVLLKVARGGTLLAGQDPQGVPNKGGVYKNGRRAIIGWLRGFVDAEVKAGRRVDMQIAELAQGEREAAVARSAGNLAYPGMQGWATTLRTRIYSYYAEKFGVSFPLLVRQLLPIRVANTAQAEIEPYTAAQNRIEESACRYTVTINDDGTIRTVTDNGAGPTRIPNAYFLKHDRTNPNLIDVHADYALSRLFGIAKVNLQKYLEAGNQGLTGHSIKRVAPVIMSYSVDQPTATTLTVNLFVDEAARIRILAVPANAPRPTPAQINQSGMSVTSTVDINGNGWPQSFDLVGLTPQAAYDVYAVAADPVFGHTGSVFKVGAGIRTTPR